MARGVIPRQPAKSGRQERAGRVDRGAAARAKSGAHNSSRSVFQKTVAKRTVKAKAAKPKPSPSKRYNPLAPERVHAILNHLDALYPKAVCALHHPAEASFSTILPGES